MKYLLPAALTLVILGLSQVMGVSEEVAVAEVVDGDTINTENDTVRFLGVDTPETSSISENRPQDYGLENDSETVKCLDRYGIKASEFVKNSTGENITLVYDRKSDDRGQYGRKLSYIRADNDINRKLLIKGLARVYPSGFSRWNEFYFWQYVAKKNDRGIWSC